MEVPLSLVWNVNLKVKVLFDTLLIEFFHIPPNHQLDYVFLD